MRRTFLGLGAAAMVLAWTAPGARGGVLDGGPAIYQKPSSIWAIEARIHLDRKQWGEAAASLTRALHEEPENIRIAVQLADVYYRLRDYHKSIEILSDFLTRATKEYNIPYRLGLDWELCFDYQKALGYYFKALEIDPYMLSAYVRIAQVRIKQGFAFDAAKALRRCLEIDPGYTPALEELKIVNALVKSDLHNVYRRGNLVVVFDHYNLVTDLEKLYPKIEQHRQYIEQSLAYHIPDLWVKVVPKIDKGGSPPALYDELEDAILVSEDALKRQDDKIIAHEMTYLYVERMTAKAAPRWMVEGLALWVSHPDFIDRTPLRTMDLTMDDVGRRFSSEKRYLWFDADSPPMKLALVKVYVFVRFLADSYGVVGIRQLLAGFREGLSSMKAASWDVLHIPYDQLISKFHVYSITRFFFETPGSIAF